MGFMYMNWDIWYFVLVVPAFVFSLIASSAVKRTFRKYDSMPSSRKITGAQAARRILDQNDLRNVAVEQVQGELTDHYDPRSSVLRLSQATYNSVSVAAIGVAAHEAGHAIQHERSYIPNKIRAVLVPVANIGSRIGPYLALFGLILKVPFLTNIGIALFAAAVLFYLITLPVEFNASRRAIKILDQTGILYGDEITAAKKVLSAAAMTYIASLAVAVASFVRLILLSRGRRR